MRLVDITHLVHPQYPADKLWVIQIVAGPFRTEAGAERWVNQHKLDFQVSGSIRKRRRPIPASRRHVEP